jgi:sphingomyelin phosphodiesterase acid-like 3
MKMLRIVRRLMLGGVAVCCVISGPAVDAQAKARTAAKKATAPQQSPAPASPVTALMMSDIHFDPFRDPGKAQRLLDAQESEWNEILSGPDSADRAETFAKVQTACKARRFVMTEMLLQSSLAAMKQSAPDAKFALVSGDLVVHDFDCRFKTVFPGKTEAEYTAFAAKTLRYVVAQIRLSLAGMPVYVALGNNDSGCTDYFMDRGDKFLKETEEAMLDGLASSRAEKKAAETSYSLTGDMSLKMKAPMQRTRLILLNDTFQSRKYETCGHKPNPEAVGAQIAWLTKQLAAARRLKEKVWVVGHIPPGIDPYSTFSKFKNVCVGDQPVMFLSSERLADVMGAYADVIQLGLFGHSHMDEMRLFGTDGKGARGKVAIKMISSISPWDGNYPSFTVARVDPAKSRLLDYDVIAASNMTGVNAVWTKEYSYGETFHKPDFSAGTLNTLFAEFSADPDARDPMSRAFLQHYFVGDQSLLLKSLWPQYVCTLGNHTVKGFAACVCPAPGSPQ